MLRFGLNIATLLITVTAHAAPYRTVYAFTNNDGFLPTLPSSGVTFGPDGNLYGVTAFGGGACLGTVYGITTAGVLMSRIPITSHRLPNGDCQGGRIPLGALTFDPTGAIYGTASADMATASEKCCGRGAVFRIADGKLKTLYYFPPNGTRGATPGGRLVIDRDGNAYGTTQTSALAGKSGVIFKVSLSGAQTIMHVGVDNSDLIMDPTGSIYGTQGDFTNQGGGSVYKLAPDGTFTVLHAFSGSFRRGDGTPIGGVVRDSAGDLYGITSGGGTHRAGTIYKIDRSGVFSTFYSFRTRPLIAPTQGISIDSDGNIYGTSTVNADEGAPCNCPSIFKLTPTGEFSILYQFRQQTLSQPFTTGYSGALAVGADGWLYGTIPIGNDPSRSGVLYAVQYKAMPGSSPASRPAH